MGLLLVLCLGDPLYWLFTRWICNLLFTARLWMWTRQWELTCKTQAPHHLWTQGELTDTLTFNLWILAMMFCVTHTRTRWGHVAHTYLGPCLYEMYLELCWGDSFHGIGCFILSYPSAYWGKAVFYDCSFTFFAFLGNDIVQRCRAKLSSEGIVVIVVRLLLLVGWACVTKTHKSQAHSSNNNNNCSTTQPRQNRRNPHYKGKQRGKDKKIE